MSNAEIILLIAVAVLTLQALVVYRFGRADVEGAALVRQVELARGEPSLRWIGWKPFYLVSRTPASADGLVVSFDLAPVDGQPLPLFKPGQHLNVRVKLGPDELVRCYSLSGSPYATGYRISVKQAPPPKRVSGFLHEHFIVGAQIDIRAPAGDFTLDPHRTWPCALIAGGVGVTPIWSMLLACAQANPSRAIWLFYGVGDSTEDVLLAETPVLCQHMPNLTVNRFYAGQTGKLPATIRSGFITADLVLSQVKAPEAQFYVCGPAGMMESLVPALRAKGVSEDRLHFETFGPSSLNQIQAIAALPAQVHFSKSSKTATWTSGSLLELAEQQGVRIESSCRSGQCGTCETAVVSGSFVYMSKPSYTPEDGKCLLCVSRPDGDLELQA
jgi:ferredoxin-NADP reductase